MLLKNELIFLIIFCFSLSIIFSLPNLFKNNSILKKYFNFHSFFYNSSLILIIYLNIFLIISFFNFRINFILYFLLGLNIIVYLKYFYLMKIKLNYFYILFIFFLIFLSIDLSYSLTFDWDTKWFWFYKVKNFYYQMGFDNLNKYPVSDYPHFGSYLWASFWSASIINLEYFGRVFYLFVFLLSIFSLFELSDINKFYNIILISCIIFIVYNYNIISGDQDILIFSILNFILKEIYFNIKFNKNFNNNYFIFIFFLTSNLLIWLKNEGIFYSIIIIICLQLSKYITRSTFIKLIFTQVLIIFFRYIFNILLQIKFNSDWYQINETISIDWLIYIEKIKIIIFYFFVYLIKNPIYIIILPLFIISLFTFNKNHKFSLFIILLYILMFIFIFFVFFFKSAEVLIQVKSSMHTLLFQISGINLITLLYLTNKMKYKKK